MLHHGAPRAWEESGFAKLLRLEQSPPLPSEGEPKSWGLDFQRRRPGHISGIRVSPGLLPPWKWCFVPKDPLCPARSAPSDMGLGVKGGWGECLLPRVPHD